MAIKGFKDRLLKIIEERFSGNAAKFSRFVEIPNSSIATWLSTDKVPGHLNLNKLSDKLNVSVDWLLTGTGQMFTTPVSLSGSIRAEASGSGALSVVPGLTRDELDAIFKICSDLCQLGPKSREIVLSQMRMTLRGALLEEVDNGEGLVTGDIAPGIPVAKK